MSLLVGCAGNKSSDAAAAKDSHGHKDRPGGFVPLTDRRSFRGHKRERQQHA